MKLIGKYTRAVTNEDGNVEITFTLQSYFNIQSVKDFAKNVLYRLSIVEEGSKRSSQQNRYLWSLINDIAEQTNNSDYDVYVAALERANCSYEYYACLPQAEESIKRAFRAVKYINSFEHNGKTFNQYKCYNGSSSFNTKEMNQLIEIVQLMASEAGVPYEVDYQ